MESVGVDEMSESIIPGLPNDLALRCLAMISHGYHGLLECVSKRWKRAIRSKYYADLKAEGGWSGDWLFVLGSNNSAMWLAYDPDANRWRPLPQMPGPTSDDEFCRFSCANICNKFLVIGGCYIPRSTVWSETNLLEVNSVIVFDTFKKEWSTAASMSTKRIDFAYTAIGEKVYLAGGRNSDKLQGLASAQILRVLITILDTSTDPRALAVACYDLSQFIKYHPAGRIIVLDLKAKDRVMKLMNHENAEVMKNALLCIQRLFLGAKYASFLQS
ncbi:F-box/kelch-repeat protein At1g16250-like [Zingiber officinale]|uniref:F-box/kelch-repeat protein At1g16250-like n=1 Tax=Zingiber officinale TaxID=94328 RepID=UPI001C4AD4D2|nr:F-box/kelch-repeat protein At1g16250-like [Zingiber officinale]